MLAQIHRDNLTRGVIWIIVIAVCTFVNVTFVHINYDTMGESTSVSAFIQNFLYAALMILILTLVWWWCATTEWTVFSWIREKLEQNTFVWALTFCGLTWLITAGFYFRLHVITYNRAMYSLPCILMLPSMFTGLMFFLPPVHVNKVILPGSGICYWLFRIVVILLAFGGAAWFFRESFIS